MNTKNIIMKRTGLLIIAILLPIMLSAQTMSAKEIIRKADDKARGESSAGTMTMTIERPAWSRTIEMKTWSLGTEYYMIYIISPAKEKGQVFLKRGNEMWNWVPSIERMIKIPPSMMMQSWMGSDFTNDDLVKESSILKDYTHTLLGKENIRGRECYKIQLIPKEDAPVVWGKIISWISVDSFDQWRVEFYDEDGFLINTQTSSKPVKMGDRILPSEMTLIPEDKPKNKTTILMKDMEFNIKIDATFFSQQNMKSLR